MKKIGRKTPFAFRVVDSNGSHLAVYPSIGQAAKFVSEQDCPQSCKVYICYEDGSEILHQGVLEYFMNESIGRASKDKDI